MGMIREMRNIAIRYGCPDDIIRKISVMERKVITVLLPIEAQVTQELMGDNEDFSSVTRQD
jgi:hypothetical protein